MSIVGLASKCSVTSVALEALIAGKVGVGIASSLGVTSSSLQTFVNGGTSIGLAGKMGITSTTLRDLRNAIGKDGAIGLIIGLMVEKS